MKIEPQTILLKNKRSYVASECGEENLLCILKSPDAEDAAEFINIM